MNKFQKQCRSTPQKLPKSARLLTKSVTIKF